MKPPGLREYLQGRDGSNWAILVHRITAEGVSGWGPGEPLEYAKWKIHDTGLPGGKAIRCTWLMSVAIPTLKHLRHRWRRRRRRAYDDSGRLMASRLPVTKPD